MDKKKRASSSAVFYATLAVCLAAAGVGGYQLIRIGNAAQSRTAAASGPAQVARESAQTNAPDASEAAADASDAVSGGDVRVSGEAAIPAGKPAASGDSALSPPDAESSTESGGTGKAGEKQSGTTSTSGKSGTEQSGTAGGSGKSGTAGAAGKSGTGKSSTAGQSDTSGKSGGTDAAQAGTTGGSDASTVATGASGEPDADRNAAAVSLHADILPLEGETVTAFSVDKLQFNETLRDWRTHDGVDVAAAEGTPVLAACAGTVVSVSDDPLLGCCVTVRHEGAVETLYGSLRELPDVEAGEEISAGQVLGFVGESAASESALGPHLHFAVRENGEARDPEEFLEMARA